MKRRHYLGVLGTVALAGCSSPRDTEEQLDTESFEIEDLRVEGITFLDGDQELFTINLTQRQDDRLQYPFQVQSVLGEEFDRATVRLEFTFPVDELRPPDIYLRGQSSIPPTSLERRTFGDESTIVEVPELTRETVRFPFTAVPHDDVEGDIPMTMRVGATLGTDGVFGTDYEGAAELSTELGRWVV